MTDIPLFGGGWATLNQDLVPDGTTNKAYTATEQSKLASLPGGSASRTVTATAGGTTTLTSGSTPVQVFTGILNQTVLLPTTGIIAGQTNTIINNSTGTVAVQSSAGNSLITVGPSKVAVFCPMVDTPTAATDWNVSGYTLTSGGSPYTLALHDAYGWLNSIGYAPSIQTWATAAGTTTMTWASYEIQVFTGITTQTAVLPTSTAILGGRGLTIINASTGAVTVTASGGATVAVLLGGTSARFTALQTNPTTAAHWQSSGANMVDLSSAQTLTSKTLTSPKIGTSILDTNGNTMVTLTPTASAVNGISLLNAAAAGTPSVQATGSDTDVGLNVYSKAAGAINLRSTNGMIAQFLAPASAVNYLYFQSAAASSGLAIQALGADINISISANPKGSGVFQVGGVTVPTVSSTSTLTNKRVTARVGTVASSATPAINTDSYDHFTITALAADITSMTSGLTGTPTDGQHLLIRFKDNGTARAITWGASFTGNLLSTTVISKTHVQELVYDSASSKWAGTYYDATGY